MSFSAWRAAGLGLVFWLAAVPARAAVSLQIPPECGSQPEFEQELEQRLGSVSAQRMTRVTLTPEPDGYRLLVEAGNQTRELHDASCPELLRAAVVVALALLEPPRAAETSEAPPPAPAPEPAPPARALEAAPTRHEPRTANHAQRLHWALGAGAGVHIGTLPTATLMLDLDAQLKWTRFGIAAGFRYLLPSETRNADGLGVRVFALGASVAGLYEPWQRLQLRLGLATYRLSGAGIGSVETSDGSAWEVAPTVGAAFVLFQRAPFWSCLGLEGQLNLIRPTFEILSYNDVFQVSRASGSAFVHAGVVF